jgi:hypothetical protein
MNPQTQTQAQLPLLSNETADSWRPCERRGHVNGLPHLHGLVIMFNGSLGYMVLDSDPRGPAVLVHLRWFVEDKAPRQAAPAVNGKKHTHAKATDEQQMNAYLRSIGIIL